MKIVHVTHGLTVGGMESFIRDFCNHYPDAEHIITVFPGRTGDIVFNNNVKIRELKSLVEVRQIYDKENADLVHIHWTGPEAFNKDTDVVKVGNQFFVSAITNSIDNNPTGYAFIHTLWDSSEELPPIIITCHSEYRLPSNCSYPYVQAVVHVSKKAQVTQKFIHSRHEVIYNGLDLERYKPRKKIERHKKTIVTWTGRVSKFDTKVFYALNQDDYLSENCEFWFIGEDYEHLSEDDYQNYRFFGKVNNVEYYLNNTDIYLYPTTIDSFGLAIAEAMACGLPVIGSNVVSEVIDTSGLVYDTPQHCVTCLTELVKDKALRKVFGRKARRRAENYFDIYKMVERYRELYGEIINGK